MENETGREEDDDDADARAICSQRCLVRNISRFDPAGWHEVNRITHTRKQKNKARQSAAITALRVDIVYQFSCSRGGSSRGEALDLLMQSVSLLAPERIHKY